VLAPFDVELLEPLALVVDVPVELLELELLVDDESLLVLDPPDDEEEEEPDDLRLSVL
jgi:hypothetical protein